LSMLACRVDTAANWGISISQPFSSDSQPLGPVKLLLETELASPPNELEKELEA
jgi:hypothetical protein